MNKPEKLPGDESRDARQVFVSYATADRKEALSVCKAVERRGTKCWISCRDVKPGENYQEEIVRAIRDARAMVLVFSEAANISDEIKKELSLASKYKLPVLALRIEDAEPSDAFAYELSTRQWIDAFHGWDKSIELDCEPHKADFRCGTGRHHGCRTASPPHNFRFAASDLDCGRGRLACAGNGWCVVVASTAPRGSTQHDGAPRRVPTPVRGLACNHS